MDATTSPARRRAPQGGGRSAALRDDLIGLLTPAVAAAGFDLEDLEVSRAGSRSVVRVVVDSDGGLDLDGVAEATRAVGTVLDDDEASRLLPGAYVLEVTSPGVDRPLTEPRHWRRAVGRLVEVTFRDGRELRVRVTEAGDGGAVVVPEPVGRPGVRASAAPAEPLTITYAEVVRATVQVEFARQGEDS